LVWKVIALRRIADMLRPGGVLRLLDLVYDFAPEEVDSVFVGSAERVVAWIDHSDKFTLRHIASSTYDIPHDGSTL
jgi:hypothetical protein